MADRYWVGGTGTWNTTSTTNWSASSGGASGASVPTSADNVFFDQAGTYTVTMTGALNCLSINVSAGTVTFATGTGPTLAIYGSMTLVAGTVWNSTGNITFASTSGAHTITTNGVTINATNFQTGPTGAANTATYTLGSSLTLGSTTILGVASGTFDTSSTGNYTVTTYQLSSNNSTTRTINLNGSTINISFAGSPALNLATITNLTFNAGTSQINFTGNGAVLASGGLTFYNVAYTNTTAGTRSVTGSNTFNNLNVTAPSSAGVTTFTFPANQTINGALGTTGTAGNRRVIFRSDTYGIARTLTCNAAASLTDADFRDLYVIGTSAPLTGTRIGDLGGVRGVTTSTPKTVYWNLAAGGNWSATAWATSSGGGVSDNNFPLAQDTAIIENTGLNASATVTLDAAITYFGTIDMSTRTNAMTLAGSTAYTVYGDWKFGSGVIRSYSGALTFAGREKTQTITSAGKSFFQDISFDAYGSSVELADALNTSYNITVNNGGFNTKNYSVTCGVFSSSNSNVRSILFGSSTVTITGAGLTAFNVSNAVNLTFNAGTSQINLSADTFPGINGGGVTFYNLSYTRPAGAFANYISGSNTFNNIVTNGSSVVIGGSNTINNLTLAAPASAGLVSCSLSGNQTITGTLTCAGASPIRRIFLQSNTVGTSRTLTVNSLSATDCDFRDITIAGTAAGSSPTRAGDCGGNSGITFPAAKTVYWNLAGAQNWSATGWCPSSGGTPDINQFPLAQDTAVFDNTGSVTGTITIDQAWNIGTFDASARTSAMTLTTSTSAPTVYGDWKFGTGVTSSSTTGTITFSDNGTQTITSNGVQFGCPVTINRPSATVQLADAISLNSARTLTLTSGTFDAVTYNVTTGLFSSAAAGTTKMGSGTWTLSGTGTVWTGAGTNIASTSTIVLSDTSTTARTFAGGGLYYNKLTIGGTTGISTLTITDNNTFGELASTKTVAHTIALGTTVQTFGKWSVTGTVGNVVTLTGTGTTHVMAGPATSGIDYLAMGSIGFSTTSPGEFYAGANSTGTAAAPVYRTATPAARTLYWVGGTGNWSDTARWSTSSGGGSGAAIPTSLDAVIFNSASNATAYTATVDTPARTAKFTLNGPASGTVTFAGTSQIAHHDNTIYGTVGVSTSHTGTLVLSGTGTGKTFTDGGNRTQSWMQTIQLYGIGSEWTQGNAIGFFGTWSVVAGTWKTANYNLAFNWVTSSNTNARTIDLGTSTINMAGNIGGATIVTFENSTNLTVANATGSTWLITGNASFNSPFRFGTNLTWGNLTSNNASSNIAFYSYNNTWGTINISAGSIQFIGFPNTISNLTIAAPTSTGIKGTIFYGNQTITGTLSVSGASSVRRQYLYSNTIGTTRTLTVNALAASSTDIDFQDITIAGAAAPLSGTRFGDAKGNSGITFPAAKTVYYGQTGSANWGATGTGSWSATSGGALDATQFPLAQDTAIFPAATYPASGSTTTINANYNIGTIDMSLRTTNTMTLATGTNTPPIYGNWINGTGITLTGTSQLTFSGRGTQTITSAGKTWPQSLGVNSPGGSVSLLDAFTTSSGTQSGLSAGTFDANGFNFTATGYSSNTTGVRTIAVGSGTWTLNGTSTAWNTPTITNLTVTGTGTISLTSASAKTFSGGGVAYTNITLNNGGGGALTISGDNTFKNITNTYSATGAATIALGSTTQTVSQWTGTGASAKVLTISGTSAASPGTLRLTSGTVTTVNYLSISSVRAYSLTSTWYAGANSTNLGSLGWIFAAAGGTTYNSTVSDTSRPSDSISASLVLLSATTDTAQTTDTVASGLAYNSSTSDTARASETFATAVTFRSSTSDTARASETFATTATFNPSVSDTANASETFATTGAFNSSVSDASTATDTTSANQIFISAVSDTSNASDSIASLVTFISSVSDTAQTAETFAARLTFVSSISDTAQTAETFAATATFRSSTSDTAQSSDTVSAQAVFISSTSDTASAADSVTPFNIIYRQVSDSAAGQDTVSSLPIYVSAFADTVRPTDTITTQGTFNPSFADTVSITDTLTTQGTFNPLVIDSAQTSELVTTIGTFKPQIIERATATEVLATQGTFNPVFADTVRPTDTVTTQQAFISVFTDTATASDTAAAKQIFLSSTVDSARPSDTITTQGTFNPSFSDAATAFDALTTGGTFNVSVLEQGQVLDVVAASAVFPVSFADSAQGSDTFVGRLTVPTAVAESASTSETVAAVQVFAVSLSEQAGASDTVLVAASVFNAQFVESVNVADVITTQATMFASVSDSILIYDAVVGAYLWNPIPTDQPGNWANINTTNSGSWNAIDTNTGAGWQNISTTNSGSWVTIDTTAAPGWTNVDTI